MGDSDWTSHAFHPTHLFKSREQCKYVLKTFTAMNLSVSLTYVRTLFVFQSFTLYLIKPRLSPHHTNLDKYFAPIQKCVVRTVYLSVLFEFPDGFICRNIVSSITELKMQRCAEFQEPHSRT